MKKMKNDELEVKISHYKKTENIELKKRKKNLEKKATNKY
jgi:hypothetical protein